MEGRRIFALFLMLILSVPLCAAEDGEEDWQYLEWQDDDARFVLRYDVIVQEIKGTRQEQYTTVRTIGAESGTTRVHITPPLAPGEYRYSVISYNLLDLPAAQSEWIRFSIYEAHRPEVQSVRVTEAEGNLIHIDGEGQDGKILITGQYLFPQEDGAQKGNSSTYTLEKAGIFPETTKAKSATASSNGTSAVAEFDTERLDPGTYYLVVTDASGLSSQKQENAKIQVLYESPLGIHASIGWSLSSFMYDDTFSTYMGKAVWPLSLTARLTVIPIKQGWGFLGGGVELTYIRMRHNAEFYRITGNILSAQMLAVYQYPFLHQKIIAEAHAGFGVLSYLNYAFTFTNGIRTESLYSASFTGTFGFAVQYNFTKQIYAELCTDFLFSAIQGDSVTGMFTPTLSAGWRF